MGTKTDPGEFDCYAKLADDEPYFLLRANDPLAMFVVNFWARLYRAYKEIPDGPPDKDWSDTLKRASQKHQEAISLAFSMSNWNEEAPFQVLGYDDIILGEKRLTKARLKTPDEISADRREQAAMTRFTATALIGGDGWEESGKDAGKTKPTARHRALANALEKRASALATGRGREAYEERAAAHRAYAAVIESGG